MAAGVQIPGWIGVSRRRVPRFRVQAPIDVIVTRSGESDTLPGRSVNVCERGIGAVLAGELDPGETVGVEVQLAPSSEPLRTKATVRYQDHLRFGLEFVEMGPEQRAAIRDWAKGSGSEMDPSILPASAMSTVEQKRPEMRSGREAASRRARAPRGPQSKAGWIVVLVLVVFAAGVFWWKWDRGWDELESGLKSDTGSEQVPIEIATDVMQRLLIHRVEPVYPADARAQNVQGIVAIDIVVARDGSVVRTRALNGPDVLARAAMDALRWWRFEPYKVNGEPVTVETTMAVEFKN